MTRCLRSIDTVEAESREQVELLSRSSLIFLLYVDIGLSVHDDPVQLAYAGDQLTLVLSGLDMMHLG